MKKIYILGAMVCGLAACKPNIEPKAPERGDADFSRYLAVGSSHTAGFTDGSYYLNGQKNSYPSMLAEQFGTVGGGEFKQPLVPGEHGWPAAKFILDYVQGPCDTLPRIAPTLFKGALDTTGTYLNIYAQSGPYGNMGIISGRVIDYLTGGFAMTNRYAARIFKTPATSRPLDELALPEHTFFTLWLGMDDVLNYAMVGGESGVGPGHVNTITLTTAFTSAYDSVLNMLTRTGAKGVAMTLPNILDMPFFSAIPAKGMEVSAKDANLLNIQYNSSQVHFDPGMNHFVIEDQSAPNNFREIKDGELVLMNLPMDSVRCKGWGWKTPIPKRYVLTSDEVLKIKSALEVFNNKILTLATKYEIAIADVNHYLDEVRDNGAQYNAADYSFTFVTGGMFSLDGVHFTGRGNALIANHLINTINSFYGSSIPLQDVNKFSGIHTP